LDWIGESVEGTKNHANASEEQSHNGEENGHEPRRFVHQSITC